MFETPSEKLGTQGNETVTDFTTWTVFYLFGIIPLVKLLVTIDAVLRLPRSMDGDLSFSPSSQADQAREISVIRDEFKSSV